MCLQHFSADAMLAFLVNKVMISKDVFFFPLGSH